MKKILMLALAVMMVFAMALTAQADLLLVYEVPGNSGAKGGTFTISGSDFIGANIPLEAIYDANSVADEFFIPGAILNFDTGAPGPNITITGANGGQTQLSGTFTGTPAVVGVTDSTFSATFTDVKPDTVIASFFGFDPTAVWNGSITLDFNRVAGTNTFATLDGSVHNNFVPIPGSLVLLGTGILGVAGIGFRRKSA